MASSANAVSSSWRTSRPESDASTWRGSFAAYADSGNWPRSACESRLSPRGSDPARAGNGSIESMPLNAHVAAPTPNTSPKIMCQRFWPR
jgi:hypothetical protein